jgi:hypothetical protein
VSIDSPNKPIQTNPNRTKPNDIKSNRKQIKADLDPLQFIKRKNHYIVGHHKREFTKFHKNALFGIV